ncbi:GtrA family protein [Sulfitobacter aestuarii]|uniref:GtrA family protein n=1 Tax=Sulfitobacter aestuarii TaxID=2161676 RepID=A0ABW5U472_9RHOB
MFRNRNSLSELLGALRFAIVGAGATLVHLLCAQLALATGVVPLALSNVIGFAVAFVAGFAGHQYYTFAGTAPLARAFRRYGIIALVGFLINNVVLFGLVAAGIVSKATALSIAILIVPVGTFLASRFWGFLATEP